MKSCKEVSCVEPSSLLSFIILDKSEGKQKEYSAKIELIPSDFPLAIDFRVKFLNERDYKDL